MKLANASCIKFFLKVLSKTFWIVIRVKLDGVRDAVTDRVEKIGMKVEHRTPAGMFLWVETGHDTITMAEKALEQGILIAPGSLFSPHQLPSTRMRLNAAMSDEDVWKCLKKKCSLKKMSITFIFSQI